MPWLNQNATRTPELVRENSPLRYTMVKSKRDSDARTCSGEFTIEIYCGEVKTSFN